MVAHPADTVAASSAVDRRVGRFRAQAFLWDHSSRSRGRSCGLRPTGGSVELRRTEHQGVGTGGFAGVQTCGSVWACPVCSARILAERQTEVEHAVSVWTGRVAFFTFTVRHGRQHKLHEVWDAVQAGHHAITSGRVHQREKSRLGVKARRVVASGARRGSSVEVNCLPWLRVVEVTHGVDHGWHVHQHMLVFLPAGMTETECKALYATWHARWAAGAAAAGLDGALMVNDGRFVDSRGGIASYVSKNTYTPAQVAGLEVARGDLKDGRLGNRSAMGILRDLVQTGASGDLALWHDFEAGSSGRRQMTWAVGARLVFGLGVERDDAEIAADVIGTEVDAVCTFEPAVYRRQIALAGRRGDLLSAVEVSADAALGLLRAWGVPYALPETVERRAAVLDPHAHLRALDARRSASERVRLSMRSTILGPSPADRHDGVTVPRALVCDVCGGRMAPAVARFGRHVGCGPSSQAPADA